MEGARYEEVTYEGYGPGGVALLVEALTDNRNRTGQEIKHAFTRLNGNLGASGSTAWMFTRKGVILVDKDGAPDEDRMLEIALDAGADDLSGSDTSWEITTDPGAFRAVRSALSDAGIEPSSAELTMVPNSTVSRGGLTGSEPARSDRGARGPRRRPGRLRELRHPGRSARRGRLRRTGMAPPRRGDRCTSSGPGAATALSAISAAGPMP
jgi:hypothetical protein